MIWQKFGKVSVKGREEKHWAPPKLLKVCLDNFLVANSNHLATKIATKSLQAIVLKNRLL